MGLANAQVKAHPCQAWAKRRLRHEDERFPLVMVDGVRVDHHLAERRMRSLVVIRTISGGSRSPEGTKTRMPVASRFETWQNRGRNPFDECLRLRSQGAASEKSFSLSLNTYVK